MGPTGLVFLSIVTDLCIQACIIYLLRVIYQSNNCKELLFRKNIFCSSSFYIYIKTSKSGMKFFLSRFMNILVNHQNYRNVPKRAVILCSHKDLHILGNIQTYFIHTIFKWQFNSYFISKYSICLYQIQFSWPKLKHRTLFITFFDVLVLQKDVRTWTTSREA